MSGARRLTATISGTSPATPGTAVLGKPAPNLEGFDTITIVATLRGGTGGVLDIYLQFSPDGTKWFDWAHFAQLADGVSPATRVWSVVRGTALATPAVVGSEETPALAVNTFLATDWGTALRVLAVAGNQTTAGGVQQVVLLLSRLSELGA